MRVGRSRFIGVAVLAIAISGCTGVQQRWQGWFGSAPTHDEAGQVYFSAVKGLTVHAEPSGTAKVLGRLSLHEKVTRLRVQQGYAFVTSAAGGTAGWVDNAQLIWRLPTSAGPPPTRSGAPSAPRPASAPQPTADSPAIPVPRATDNPAGTAAAAVTAEPDTSQSPQPPAVNAKPPTAAAANAEPKRPAAEMFDPF
jgi:hypothetical protein